MARIVFEDDDGEQDYVSEDNPLPVSGAAGGGGMEPDDISASSPLSWDEDEKEMSISLSDVATSGDYGDLSGTPSLSSVATSGDYDDLSGTPDLADVATSGEASDVDGLSSVATSGDYDDLSGKPKVDHVEFDEDDVEGTLESVIDNLIEAGLMADED